VVLLRILQLYAAVGRGHNESKHLFHKQQPALATSNQQPASTLDQLQQCSTQDYTINKLQWQENRYNYDKSNTNIPS